LVQAAGSRPKIVVSGDGRGVIGHAGARLLADVAEVTGLAASAPAADQSAQFEVDVASRPTTTGHRSWPARIGPSSPAR
jgi:hypothetical protein